MKKNRFFRLICFFILLTAVAAAVSLWNMEPKEIRKLRKESVVQQDEGHQEYYFKQLNDNEKRVYREMLEGIRKRENEFYLTSSDESMIGRAYHALLKDHAELFWVHNRESVYTTSYQDADYCRFSPGYTYTDQEIEEISAAAQKAFGEFQSLIPANADTYEKVKTAYTYLIDTVEYADSEDDQNIAGSFWRKKAVCAGYARALQYFLEELDIPCVYVEGDSKDSAEGHAWNIVEIDGQQYYVDVTNGDQPDFLEGDAVQLAEHKTIIYDYLCPFPEEYEQVYTPSDEFSIPQCTSTEQNFYVRNQACFDTYDEGKLYDFCCMRLDNGAAVVRFKCTSQEVFDKVNQKWIDEGYIQNVAEYYLSLYGMSTIEYHYGILKNLKTMYFMF